MRLDPRGRVDRTLLQERSKCFYGRSSLSRFYGFRGSGFVFGDGSVGGVRCVAGGAGVGCGFLVRVLLLLLLLVVMLTAV